MSRAHSVGLQHRLPSHTNVCVRTNGVVACGDGRHTCVCTDRIGSDRMGWDGMGRDGMGWADANACGAVQEWTRSPRISCHSSTMSSRLCCRHCNCLTLYHGIRRTLARKPRAPHSTAAAFHRGSAHEGMGYPKAKAIGYIGCTLPQLAVRRCHSRTIYRPL